jgi:hypothetical protein
MAQGIRALRKLQFGQESTPGTIVAATTKWRGTGTIEDTRVLKHPTEDVGLLVPTDRTYVPLLGAKLALESTPATFEQLPYILETSIKKIGTGVADGTGDGKIYDYVLAETALNTLGTLTIEGGDNAEAEVMEYGFTTDFTLDGKPGEAWMMSANLVGRQVAIQAFTGSIAIPTVEEILFSKTKLYIEAAGGTYGATQKANTLIAAKLNVKSGWVPTAAMDGNLYFRSAQYSRDVFSITLDLTFELESTAVQQKVDWRAHTAHKISLITQGSAITQGSGVYAYKTLKINLGGDWVKFSKIGEKDGNDIVTGTFRAAYNATNADIGNIIVVNTLAALP